MPERQNVGDGPVIGKARGHWRGGGGGYCEMRGGAAKKKSRCVCETLCPRRRESQKSYF